ncbi:twin-arginine translocation pathway signal protein [Roseibium denhamense]|uniref:Formate dehydrogenase region TAT target n=1 Tax=Roseibium denhamense TaxID=76305 RepID=A0ABY1NGZ7_9HYPH|nr:twin-arginine translocation pathway signal protein [Roseibium denhamense]MTI06465.1 twin-arginine translocation pathway signal protein [Roseibium denhamense]SMP09376.1 formate dehydrogenase region TAT target [Roseibium denhamense]
MKPPEKAGPQDGADRRNFLKLAALSAPLAAAATAVGTAAQAAEPDLTSEKMQDTAHTRAYFDSARF